MKKAMDLQEFSSKVMSLSDKFSVHIQFSADEGNTTWYANAKSYSTIPFTIVTHNYEDIEDVLEVLETEILKVFTQRKK